MFHLLVGSGAPAGRRPARRRAVPAGDQGSALSLHRSEFHGDWNYELRPCGRIAGSWTGGAVAGVSGVGGLVGTVDTGSTVVAAYSTASVTITGASGGGAGLVGWNGGGIIRTSYSTGAVTGGGTQRGFSNGGTVVASYWDTTASGISDDQDPTPPEGQTTAVLTTPTEYGMTGLYQLGRRGRGRRRHHRRGNGRRRLGLRRRLGWCRKLSFHLRRFVSQ